jgi:hypothetical protein
LSNVFPATDRKGIRLVRVSHVGNAATETLPAFTEDEYREINAALP